MRREVKHVVFSRVPFLAEKFRNFIDRLQRA